MNFLGNDSGAVTVDWVVLTAGLVGLGMATMAVVSTGVQDTSGDIQNQLESDDIIQSAFVLSVAVLSQQPLMAMDIHDGVCTNGGDYIECEPGGQVGTAWYTMSNGETWTQETRTGFGEPEDVVIWKNAEGEVVDAPDVPDVIPMEDFPT